MWESFNNHPIIFTILVAIILLAIAMIINIVTEAIVRVKISKQGFFPIFGEVAEEDKE